MEKLKLPLESSNILVQWANSIRAFYGHPVYLVGSHLKNVSNPRDVDIICIIPNEEFDLRYGSTAKWFYEGESGIYTDISWNWSDDCIKKTLLGCKKTGMCIDFKVYPEIFAKLFDAVNYPKIKIDTRKDNG